MLNFSVTPKKSSSALFATMKFRVPQGKKDKEYRQELMSSTSNLCKTFEGNRANFVMKILFENIVQSSANIEHICPFPPRRHDVWNLKLSDRFFPTYLMITESLEFLIEVRVKARVENVKSLVYFYTAHLIGVIEK